MQLRQITTLSTLCFLLSACAEQPIHNAYVPGLGEIMAQTAARHSKLWFAGLAQNWELAAYEIDELKEGFDDAAHYHPTHKDIKQPLSGLLATYMNFPLERMEASIRARDTSRFLEAFASLTDACNACHQATDFGFNRAKQPDTNPFSNQKF